MCACGGSGTIEITRYPAGTYEIDCPDDDCLYWEN